MDASPNFQWRVGLFNDNHHWCCYRWIFNREVHWWNIQIAQGHDIRWISMPSWKVYALESHRCLRTWCHFALDNSSSRLIPKVGQLLEFLPQSPFVSCEICEGCHATERSPIKLDSVLVINSFDFCNPILESYPNPALKINLEQPLSPFEPICLTNFSTQPPPQITPQEMKRNFQNHSRSRGFYSKSWGARGPGASAINNYPQETLPTDIESNRGRKKA